ncbi:hypothetical protein B8281_15955 [Cellulosimicrobium sp. TH-20]|uniref:hypothetical protein n=1 Tax=Cellulosimicrobium sp. TH-20 TaxID=1980001 RepID=UPI000A17CCED|nr:hypothetical protein [Cellulosimicrobium sp. TH-20]ARK05986.1 hypothetical protein B8281_15955 [Cellulosimicrobium sp. TH-20]
MVTVVVPSWMWGGKPKEYLQRARLRARTASKGLNLQTFEAYRRTRPNLVENAVLVDERGRPGAGSGLTSSLADPKIERPILAELAARGRIPAEPVDDDLPALLYHLRVQLATANERDLATRTLEAAAALRTIVYSEDGTTVLPHASVHMVRRSEALVHRFKLISVLVRVSYDERLSKGDPSHVMAQHAEGGRAFDSSGGLSDGVYVIDAYVAPLLAALSPGIWALPVYRVHGTVLLSLGRPISGTREVQNELIRTLTTVGPEEGVTFAPFGATNTPQAAITWWSEQLDLMFGVLTDPGAFANLADEFQPTIALQNLLSVEQVFRRVNSILLAYHDTHARRPAFFTVMDTMMTLNGLSLLTMFNHTHALAVLTQLETTIPGDAHEILLPAARRGVEALRQVQDGFFIREPDGRVRLRRDKPPLAAVDAAAKYVDMLRDATHGFTTVRSKAAQREEVATMLAIHDGRVPHELGLVAWLYLLDFLSNPARLRRIVSRTARQ